MFVVQKIAILCIYGLTKDVGIQKKKVLPPKEKRLSHLYSTFNFTIFTFYIYTEIVIVKFDFTIFQMPIYVGIVVVKQRERNMPVSL